MKIEENKATIRKIDDALTIISLFDGKNFNFDCVIGELNGIHPKVVNKISDRIYYILKGEGIVSVGDNNFNVKKGDTIVINKNEPHGLQGNLKYLIVTSPPFNPQNEHLYEEDTNRK